MKPDHYINRELSRVEFYARVLCQAADRRTPLLERVKFVAIFASILDEFFEVRVAGLRRQIAAGRVSRTPDGLSPAETLSAARARLLDLFARHSAIYRELRACLAAERIRIVDHAEVPAHHAALRERFIQEVFPVLTPLAVDPGHPFPFISSLSLSVAVLLREPHSDVERFARVKVPPILPRLIEVEPGTYVFLEELIRANLDLLFRGMDVVGSYTFRVTRDADLDIAEDEADDLLLAVEEELRRRRFGQAVRLEFERETPPHVRTILRQGIGVGEDDCYEIEGPLDLTGLFGLLDQPRPDLKLAPWTPVVPARLAAVEEDAEPDIFAAIRAGDLLVHHPYESFDASVERLLNQAARDPDVLSIKQTLYRIGGDSPLVKALLLAAENGKQVAVLVEIKARADEVANIAAARRLERAGAHVAYGLVGLKTHAKVCLVVRREEGGIRRYVHVGTGNYNPKTARLYTDLGLFSCRPELGADATELFNVLTGLSRQREFRRFLVAPHSLRSRVLELIDREATNARMGREARIVIKINHIVDPGMVAALYAASTAGVTVDLIVRTMCSIVPGVPGLSPTTHVRSVVGEYLEHSRVLGFANGGAWEWYLGSADFMERNLDRRVEVVIPVEDAEAKARLRDLCEEMLADDRNSWQLGSDGVWRSTEEITGQEGTRSVFRAMKSRALEGATASTRTSMD